MCWYEFWNKFIIDEYFDLSHFYSDFYVLCAVFYGFLRIIYSFNVRHYCLNELFNKISSSLLFWLLDFDQWTVWPFKCFWIFDLKYCHYFWGYSNQYLHIFVPNYMFLSVGPSGRKEIKTKKNRNIITNFSSISVQPRF